MADTAGYGSGDPVICPEHGMAYPCPVPIQGHWMIEDGDDGWYVVRPWDQGRCGPFSEEEAGQMLPILQARYP
jgi:hypothetical protein